MSEYPFYVQCNKAQARDWYIEGICCFDFVDVVSLVTLAFLDCWFYKSTITVTVVFMFIIHTT